MRLNAHGPHQWEHSYNAYGTGRCIMHKGGRDAKPYGDDKGKSYHAVSGFFDDKIP